MSLKRALLAQTALCAPVLLAFGMSAASAADLAQPFNEARLPAVSALNGKLDVSYGGASRGDGLGTPPIPLFAPDEFDSAFRVRGALSIPLGFAFGSQTDATFASIKGQTFGQVAEHLFWRDPAVGLAGVYGSYGAWNGIHRGRVAFEGELYHGQLTLKTVTGGEFGDVKDSVFTITGLDYYLTDDFKASIGYRYNGAGSSVAGGLEYQFASGPTAAWSVFADGEIGENDYQKIFGGVRLYFGADKSLIRRHREDDPDINDDEHSLTGCTEPGAVSVDSVSTGDKLCNTADIGIR